MFAVIYKWRVKPKSEKQFIEGWSEITEYVVGNFNALGSRLHRASDGLWYAYANWRSFEERNFAFQNMLDIPAREKMNQAIEESFPEIKLELIADLLVSPAEK